MNPTLTRESRAKKILDMALASDEKGAKRKIPIKKDSDAESQRISKSVVNVGSTSVNNALPDYVNLPWDELEGILQSNWTAVKETIRARKKLFLPTDLPLRSPQQTQNSTETEFNLLEDIYSNELPTSFEKNESSREKRECFTLTSSQTTGINSTEGCIEIPSLESVQEVCIIAPPFSSNENNFKNKTPPSTPRHIRSYNEDTLKTHCLDKEFLISLSPAEIECLPDLALPKRIVTESPFPDPIVIVVPADSEKNVTDNKGKGKRRYDRKNYCIYCECLVLNFRRHMLRRHKNEQPIAKYLAMFETCSENSKCMRGQILEELRNKGNFIYNRKVLKESHGNDLTEQLIPVKRSGINTTKSFDDYVTCVSCQALLSKKSFYKHAPKCAVNKTTTVKEQNDDCDSDDSCLERPRKCPNFVKKYGILTYPDYPELTKLMKEKIFPLLNKDDVGKAALGDSLILQLTSDFLSNHNNRKNFYSITRKMRDGAKLLLTIKQKDSEILQFEDCFKPSKINIVLQSVKEMCGCEEDGNVRVIGMPARLAWIINESCARILDNVITSDAYTDEQKEIQKREVMDFKSVVNRRWRYIVSTNAEVSRKRKKLLKPVVMPEDSDIKKFAGFIKELEIKMYEELKSKISVSNYEALCEATIAHIITLCRRRPAEAASAELSYYINRNKDNYVSSEVVGTLSSEEKVAMANLDMFIVPGKNERHVPVLLTEQMKKNIDLIISCRKKLKIPNSNKYIFARPGLESNFIGSHILDKLRKQCPGLNKPNYLTATGLRHHCATVSQVHGDQFTEYLSQFMGHNKDIHKKNYQFPLSLIQKGILGNQMLLMEGSVPESATIINNKDDQNNLEIQGLSHNRESNTTMADKNIENHVYDFLEDAGTSSNDEVSKPHISIRRKKRWTEEEKDIVIKEFSIYIRNKSNPGLKTCADLILKNPVLASRTSQQINTMIDNIIRGKLKLPCRYKHLKDV